MISELLNDMGREPLFYIALIGILGLVVGSFLNVAIYRLPRMLLSDWHKQATEFLNEHPSPEPLPTAYSLWRPRSHCPHCQAPITAKDNIPLISYLLLRGQCRHCQYPISARYPLIEMLSFILAVYAAWHFGWSLQLLCGLLITWVLLILTFIDLAEQILPDDLTLGLVWFGLLISLGQVFTDSTSAILGAVLGYSSLWSVNALYKLYSGKEGMGYGDFKLLAGLGACLGWSVLPLILFIASATGAVVGIFLILFKKHERSQPIPFGPYLAFAGWLALFQGHTLIADYWQWF